MQMTAPLEHQILGKTSGNLSAIIRTEFLESDSLPSFIIIHKFGCIKNPLQKYYSGGTNENFFYEVW